MTRLMIKKIAPGAYEHLYALDNSIRDSGLDPVIWELVRIRASQMNGCAFCVNMHSFAAQSAGETPERLFGIAAWQESPFFTDRERAALALSEAATICSAGVPDDVWKAAASYFTEAELAALVLAIAVINLWNRIAVSTQMIAVVPARGSTAKA